MAKSKSERVTLLETMESYVANGTSEGPQEVGPDELQVLSRHFMEWAIRITFENGRQVTEFSREIRPMSAATLTETMAAGPETGWSHQPDEPTEGYGRVKARLRLCKEGPITTQDAVDIAAIDVYLEESGLLP